MMPDLLAEICDLLWREAESALALKSLLVATLY